MISTLPCIPYLYLKDLLGVSLHPTYILWHLLSCYILYIFFCLSFLPCFCFCFFAFVVALQMTVCSPYIFLSSRPRTYRVGIREYYSRLMSRLHTQYVVSPLSRLIRGFGNKYTIDPTIDPPLPWEDQGEWHRMTTMTEPDCPVITCNSMNTHTHTQLHGGQSAEK